MLLSLQPATARDVPELVLFRTAVNRSLAHQYGEGYWVARSTERGALAAMKRGSVYVGRFRGRIIASLTLSATKPWAIDARYFKPGETPLYLTSMAVDPRYQRKGIGRRCMEEARRGASRWRGRRMRSGWTRGTRRRVRASSIGSVDIARWDARRIGRRG